jgi:hypothetical protein
MKDDLTKFEKDMLKAINFMNNTKYTHKNFMEWSNDLMQIYKNLSPNEKIYKAFGYYIAIKPDKSDSDTMITDWLEKYGDPSIERDVEKTAFILEIEKTVKETPNDIELGRKIRSLVNEHLPKNN